MGHISQSSVPFCPELDRPLHLETDPFLTQMNILSQSTLCPFLVIIEDKYYAEIIPPLNNTIHTVPSLQP